MKYLVMEVGLSYAVALDEEGRFVKMPNMGYEVGQTVEDALVFDGPLDLERDVQAVDVLVDAPVHGPAGEPIDGRADGNADESASMHVDENDDGYADGSTKETAGDFDAPTVARVASPATRLTGSRAPAPPRRRAGRALRRRIAILAAAASVFLFAATGFAVWQTPVGMVRMRINPAVRMGVNRFDRVVDLAGDNADGYHLIDGYGYYGKDVDDVSRDLVERAREQGYLKSGGLVRIDADSDDAAWADAVAHDLLAALSDVFDDDADIELDDFDDEDLDADDDASDADDRGDADRDGGSDDVDRASADGEDDDFSNDRARPSGDEAIGNGSDSDDDKDADPSDGDGSDSSDDAGSDDHDGAVSRVSDGGIPAGRGDESGDSDDEE